MYSVMCCIHYYSLYVGSSEFVLKIHSREELGVHNVHIVV